jgi:hypothetical protein
MDRTSDDDGCMVDVYVYAYMPEYMYTYPGSLECLLYLKLGFIANSFVFCRIEIVLPEMRFAENGKIVSAFCLICIEMFRKSLIDISKYVFLALHILSL